MVFTSSKLKAFGKVSHGKVKVYIHLRLPQRAYDVYFQVIVLSAMFTCFSFLHAVLLHMILSARVIRTFIYKHDYH